MKKYCSVNEGSNSKMFQASENVSDEWTLKISLWTNKNNCQGCPSRLLLSLIALELSLSGKVSHRLELRADCYRTTLPRGRGTSHCPAPDISHTAAATADAHIKLLCQDLCGAWFTSRKQSIRFYIWTLENFHL